MKDFNIEHTTCIGTREELRELIESMKKDDSDVDSLGKHLIPKANDWVIEEVKESNENESNEKDLIDRECNPNEEELKEVKECNPSEESNSLDDLSNSVDDLSDSFTLENKSPVDLVDCLFSDEYFWDKHSMNSSTLNSWIVEHSNLTMELDESFILTKKEKFIKALNSNLSYYVILTALLVASVVINFIVLFKGRTSDFYSIMTVCGFILIALCAFRFTGGLMDLCSEVSSFVDALPEVYVTDNYLIQLKPNSYLVFNLDNVNVVSESHVEDKYILHIKNYAMEISIKDKKSLRLSNDDLTFDLSKKYRNSYTFIQTLKDKNSVEDLLISM